MLLICSSIANPSGIQTRKVNIWCNLLFLKSLLEEFYPLSLFVSQTIEISELLKDWWCDTLLAADPFRWILILLLSIGELKNLNIGCDLIWMSCGNHVWVRFANSLHNLILVILALVHTLIVSIKQHSILYANLLWRSTFAFLSWIINWEKSIFTRQGVIEVTWGGSLKVC